jgi:hypothetical protein
MAIVKDWAQEAAKELASYFSFGAGRDSYVTDEQRQRVADSYRTIILKHCPMQPDVAYMPVPRCESCGHFTKHIYESDYGSCGYLNRPVYKNFGCVERKER